MLAKQDSKAPPAAENLPGKVFPNKARFRLPLKLADADRLDLQEVRLYAKSNRPAAARYVARFVERSKASGAMQRAIDAAGLQGEVSVAPPEQESTYKGM